MSFKPTEALKKTLVLLSGDEDVLRSRGLQQIFEALDVQRDDFDLEFIDADSADPQSWIAAAGTAPFMAERRIVIVRHLLRMDPVKAAKVNFASLPPTALVVLIADSEIAMSDDREQKLGRDRAKWETVVKAAGGHIEKFSIDPKEVLQTVKAEFQRAEKKISDKALETLLEMTGGSYSRTMDEAEKLILFSGENVEIRESDVRDVVVPSREWNVFKLIDSVQNGALPEGLRQLRILVGNQPRSEDAAIGRILPMFSRHFRLLWQARVCVDAKCQPGSAPPAVLAMFPAKPNLASESPYRQKVLMSGAKSATLPQIQKCLETVSRTDARFKGLESSFSAIDSLDRMVLELAQNLAR